MTTADVLLMGGIIIGSLYLLYHSLWKKKGHCLGCGSTTCDKR